MSEIVHYASVQDGAVVQFPFSAYYFLKVCTRRGEGGVVNLWTGELLFARELEADNLGQYCKVVADSLDEFVCEDDDADDEEELGDEDCTECEYKTICPDSPFKK